jgi:hypothetical protein
MTRKKRAGWGARTKGRLAERGEVRADEDAGGGNSKDDGGGDGGRRKQDGIMEERRRNGMQEGMQKGKTHNRRLLEPLRVADRVPDGHRVLHLVLRKQVSVSCIVIIVCRFHEWVGKERTKPKGTPPR